MPVIVHYAVGIFHSLQKVRHILGIKQGFKIARRAVFVHDTHTLFECFVLFLFLRGRLFKLLLCQVKTLRGLLKLGDKPVKLRLYLGQLVVKPAYLALSVLLLADNAV